MRDLEPMDPSDDTFKRRALVCLAVLAVLGAAILLAVVTSP